MWPHLVCFGLSARALGTKKAETGRLGCAKTHEPNTSLRLTTHDFDKCMFESVYMKVYEYVLNVLSRSASYRFCRYRRNTHGLNHSRVKITWVFCETTVFQSVFRVEIMPEICSTIKGNWLGAVPEIFPKKPVRGKIMLGIQASAVNMAAAKVAKPWVETCPGFPGGSDVECFRDMSFSWINWARKDVAGWNDMDVFL